MKQLLSTLFVLCTLLFSINGISQRSKVSIGPTFSSLYISDGTTVFSKNEGYKLLLGPSIGGSAEFLTTEFVSVWAGLNISSRGSRYKEVTELPGDDYVIKSKNTFYYVDLPVFARTDFAVGSFKPYIIFGPYGGIAFYGRSQFSYGPKGNPDFENSQPLEWGENGFYKRFDYGLIGGAGLALGQFDFELSYLFGLGNISTSDIGSSRVYNRSMRFSIAFYFDENND